MLRLQGFPDDFEINVAYTQIRKIAGNSVTVNVIELIAKEIRLAINKSEPNQIAKQLEFEIFRDGTNKS